MSVNFLHRWCWTCLRRWMHERTHHDGKWTCLRCGRKTH